MADVIHIAQRRSAASFTAGLIVDAPVEAERLDRQRDRTPWFAPLLWVGLSAMLWGLIGLIGGALF